MLTRAEREGIEVGVMTADFRADIKETYELARIGYDRFSDPLADEHAPVIRQLMNHLVASGAAPLREVTLLRLPGLPTDPARVLPERPMRRLRGAGGRWRLRAVRRLHLGRHHGRSGLRPLRRRAASRSRQQCRYCGWRITARR